MKLTAEQIHSNWIKFISNIETLSSPRKEKMLELYNSLEETLMLYPASTNNAHHNAIPGGYVDHVNRVVDAAFSLNETWKKFGANQNFTDEELMFVCINHDLGKIGLPDILCYLPNDNDWRVKNMGEIYKINPELPFSTVPDRSLFILQSQGIEVSFNEYIGIKIHDGLYEDANKAYLISRFPESRLRSYLGLLVHQADMLASRVEWESDWVNKFDSQGENKSQPVSKDKPKFKASEEALKRLSVKNPSLLKALKNI